MADLYNIKGDYGHPWRLKKFVEYQHAVPSLHFRVLGEYIKINQVSKDKAVWMCWYMSCTYNELTCIILGHNHEQVLDDTEFYWENNKTFLEFNSSRRYAKNMDWFVELIQQFKAITHNKPLKWLKHFEQNEKGYNQVFKRLLKLKYTGRFSVELFMESILYLNDYLGTKFIEPSELDWNSCSNLTSALLNLMYLDEEANTFDSTGKISEEHRQLLEPMLKEVQTTIASVYPEQPNDINMFAGKLCSFRNLFKSSRYAGYHHDRELEQLIDYQQVFPQYQKDWEQVFNIREKLFDVRFLGEHNDWTGVRKGRKKMFIEQGLTGAETIKSAEKTQSRIVNIRGTNGAGKSTPLILLRDLDPDMFEVKKPVNGKNTVIATVYPTYKIVALGKYSNKCGGVDSLKDGATVRKSLKYVLKTYPEYTVIFEGIVVSTIFRTYADLFTELEEKRGLKTKILYFMPPLKMCIKRIYKRNGGKAINESLVEGKYRTMERGIEQFKTAGFNVQVVDNSTWKKKNCVEKFLKLIKED